MVERRADPRPVSVARPRDVAKAVVYPAHDGFRYTCRNAEGKVVYDSERAFRSRRDARDEVYNRWPKAKVTFDTT